MAGRLALLLFLSPFANATAPFSSLANPALESYVRQQIDVSPYSEIRMQRPTADHAVVYLIRKDIHRLEIAAVDLDSSNQPVAFHRDYALLEADRASLKTAECPDKTVEFLAVAPNHNAFEQQITEQVAQAAEAKGLKTVRLYSAQATRQNYLNYMTCPLLKGNFYDGDANPEEIVAADGTLSSKDFLSLNGALRLKVTNIWLACEAFKDPMLTAVVSGAAAQKYAAGINDLYVGPSDNTAACAMTAALNGQPMTAAFQECYKRLDDPADKWGFTGNGSDLFGE